MFLSTRFDWPKELLFLANVGVIVGYIVAILIGVGLYYHLREKKKKAWKFFGFSMAIFVAIFVVTILQVINGIYFLFLGVVCGVLTLCAISFVFSLFVIPLMYEDEDLKTCLRVAEISLLVAVISAVCLSIIGRVGNLAHFLKYIKFRK